MAIWDKVKQGIDKAGKAAQDVIDEGKLRIDSYRAREQADKAAEALGYAIFRAAESGGELEAAAHERLMTAMREREAEAKRLENELAAAAAHEEGAAASATRAPSETPPETHSAPPTTPGESSAGEPSA